MLISEPKRTELEEILTRPSKTNDESNILREFLGEFLYEENNNIKYLERMLEENFRLLGTTLIPCPHKIIMQVEDLEPEKILEIDEFLKKKGLYDLYKEIKNVPDPKVSQKKKVRLRNEFIGIAKTYGINFTSPQDMIEKISERVEEIKKSEDVSKTTEGLTKKQKELAERQKKILCVKIQEDRHVDFYLNMVYIGLLMSSKDKKKKEKAIHTLSIIADTGLVREHKKDYDKYLRGVIGQLESRFRGHVSHFIYRISKHRVFGWPIKEGYSFLNKEYVPIEVGLKRSALNFIREGVEGLVGRVRAMESLSINNLSDEEILKINKVLIEKKLTKELDYYSELLDRYKTSLSETEKKEIKNELVEYSKELFQPIIEEYNIKHEEKDGFLDLSYLAEIRKKATDLLRKDVWERSAGELALIGRKVGRHVYFEKIKQDHGFICQETMHTALRTYHNLIGRLYHVLENKKST